MNSGLETEVGQYDIHIVLSKIIMFSPNLPTAVLK